TLVRAVMVPATMRLLGNLNWWLPRPLRWLHDRIGISEGGEDDEEVLPATSKEEQSRERAASDLWRGVPHGGVGSPGRGRVRPPLNGTGPLNAPSDHGAFGAPSWNGLPSTSVDTPTLSRYGVIPPVWKGQPAPVIRHRSMSAASATTPSSSINWISLARARRARSRICPSSDGLAPPERSSFTFGSILKSGAKISVFPASAILASCGETEKRSG